MIEKSVAQRAKTCRTYSFTGEGRAEMDHPSGKGVCSMIEGE